MIPISQNQLKLLKRLNNRVHRKKENAFIIEGTRCIDEVLLHAPTLIRAIYITEAFQQSSDWTRISSHLSEQLPTALISEHDLNAICDTETPQGILALMTYPDNLPEETPPQDPMILILDKIQDPGNMGTIIRTALAAGLHELWLTHGCADPYSPKVIRSAMGAQFILKLRKFNDIESAHHFLKQYDYSKLWLTGPAATLSIFDEAYQPEKSAVVIGNEANGIDPNISVGQWVTIPMPGVAESLNAAQAATIVLFESVRRKILK